MKELIEHSKYPSGYPFLEVSIYGIHFYIDYTPKMDTIALNPSRLQWSEEDIQWLHIIKNIPEYASTGSRIA